MIRCTRNQNLIVKTLIKPQLLLCSSIFLKDKAWKHKEENNLSLCYNVEFYRKPETIISQIEGNDIRY